jgi:tetratricopeptide (TPR) repeat protein
MPEPPEKNREEKASEFHETDYYSRFHEEETLLPGTTPVENKDKSTEPTQSKEKKDPIGEQDIQEMLDAAILEGAGLPTPEPEGLDVSVKADWTTRKQLRPKTRASASEKERPILKANTAPRTEFGGRMKEHRPKRRKRRKLSSSRFRSYWRYIVMLVVLIIIAIAAYKYQEIRYEGIHALHNRAMDAHARGNFQEALNIYDLIQRLDTHMTTNSLARLSFIQAGAYESLWRKDPERLIEYREKAIQFYDKSISADESELQTYSLDSLLAKAEIYSEAALSEETGEADFLAAAVASLVECITSERYNQNPSFLLGIPQRRLAGMIQASDPERAIEILEQARELQGDMEEGLENLMIARIYQNQLSAPFKAEEFFERVRHNELASEESRAIATQALEGMGISLINPPEVLDVSPTDFDPDKMEKPIISPEVLDISPTESTNILDEIMEENP